MGIFGGLKGFGQMFDGKPGSPIEDFLRKNQMFGMQGPARPMDNMPKNFSQPSAAEIMGGKPQVGLPDVRQEMIRRNIGGAPGAQKPGGRSFDGQAVASALGAVRDAMPPGAPAHDPMMGSLSVPMPGQRSAGASRFGLANIWAQLGGRYGGGF